MLDTITGKLKYQYLKRDSTSNFSNEGVNPNDPNYLLYYTSAFDMQSNTTNLVKLTLDWTPMQNVGVSFEGVWSKIDYDERHLRTRQQRPPGLLPVRQLDRRPTSGS